MQVLFYTRLFLYLLAFGLPVIHPAIAVPYDRMGWWMWFLLIPGEMLISFYLSPPRFRAATWISAACGFLLFSTVLFSGFSSYTLLFIGVGCASFLLTALIFKTGTRGYPFAVLEQFFLGFLYYKLLSFSRASEWVARESSGITQGILVLIALTFLLHGIILYLSAYNSGKRKRGLKELFLFLALAVSAGLFTFLLLPADFVTHSVVFNLLKQEPKPRLIPLDAMGEGLEGGNLLSMDQWKDQRFDVGRYDGFWKEWGKGNQQNGEAGSSEEGQGLLEGVPSDEWYNQGTGGDNKQYAVMVVASAMAPVYAAEAYYGHFDAERGFLLSQEQALNDLVYLRLLDTWKDEKNLSDLRRYPVNIYYLSTLSDRVLAYSPYRIEPTVLNRKFHPFDFSYYTVSMISRSNLRDWMAIKDLVDDEKRSLKSYLEVTLPGPVRDSFESYLENALQNKSGYFEKVLAIFESFSSFQYEIGFDDDISVARMEEFLVEIRHGDCTEFSNTAAILTRLAGIPSRVVTGYLASKELQNLAHRRGIRILREVIEPLKDFKVQDLYLVTTAHRHSWVQIYMPGYGWVDFDPTSYAIPPAGRGNPNAMNVIIPLIQIDEVKPSFQFPWLFIGRGLLILLSGLLIAVYLYRYGKELYLRHLSRGQSPGALKALYILLLIKLSANGYALKIPSQTSLEYSKSYPELNRFASIYTTIRYRDRYEPGEKESLCHEIRSRYREILTCCKKPGLLNALRRLFSLKGLYYK